MPQKRRCQSWSDLKEAGNNCFKNGQYGEAVSLYTQAIAALEKSGKDNKDNLSILYSNRAASYLKDGNCTECVKDCTISLDLVPFGIKSLLRRAAAYEAMERYRLAYVDYKTVLQIDCNVPAAHDGTNRMMRALTEQDGPTWREKLPPIPTVPLDVRERTAQMAASVPKAQRSTAKPTDTAGGDSLKQALYFKEEGNRLVKNGEHRKAVEKYSQSLKLNPKEVTTYTNRALCYLSLKMHKEAVKDCVEALKLDSSNIKALYRRAQAYKELKEYKGCIEDLNTLLKIEPNNTAAQKLKLEVQKIK